MIVGEGAYRRSDTPEQALRTLILQDSLDTMQNAIVFLRRITLGLQLTL